MNRQTDDTNNRSRFSVGNDTERLSSSSLRKKKKSNVLHRQTDATNSSTRCSIGYDAEKSSSSLSSKKKVDNGSNNKEEKSHRKSSSNKSQHKNLLRLGLLKLQLEEASKIKSALKEIEIEKMAKLNQLREQLLFSNKDIDEKKKSSLYKKIRKKQQQNESLRRKNKLIQCSILKIKTNNPLRKDDYGFDEHSTSEETQRKIASAKKKFIDDHLNNLVVNNQQIKNVLAKSQLNIIITLQNCNNALQYYLCENKEKRLFQDCIDEIILKSRIKLKKSSFERLMKKVLKEKKKCENSPANTKKPEFHIAAGVFLSVQDEVKIRQQNAAARTIQKYVRGEQNIVVKTEKKKRKSGRARKNKMSREKNSLSNDIPTIPKDKDFSGDERSVWPSSEHSMSNSVCSKDSITNLKPPDDLLGSVFKKYDKIDMDDMMPQHSDSLQTTDSLHILNIDNEKDKSINVTFRSKIAKSGKKFARKISFRINRRLHCPLQNSEKLLDDEYYEMDFTDVMSLASTPFKSVQKPARRA